MFTLKRIFLILFIFNTANLVHANDSYLHKGVVKITTTFSNGDKKFGFGFIVFEINNTLYAVTAKHVVRAKSSGSLASTITVRLFNDPGDISASVCSAGENMDLALIKFDSPGNLLWEFHDVISRAEPGDPVALIGRYGTWSESGRSTMGTVVSVTPSTIRANFAGAAVGSSGGPLVAGGKIIGMITSDEGNQINAIPISIIRHKVSQWLNINYHKISDLPITSIGVSLGGSYKAGNLKYSSIEEGSPIFYLGCYLKNSFHKHLSFQVEWIYRNIQIKSLADYGPFNQFKNSLYTVSGSFHVNFGSNIQEVIRTDRINPTFSRFFFGGSYSHINPQVNIEKSGWRTLKNINPDKFDYAQNFYSLLLGITLSGGNFPHFSMEVDVAIEYFMSKYVYTNVHNNMYGKDTSNDWLLSANLKIGYLFRPRSSATKMLR